MTVWRYGHDRQGCAALPSFMLHGSSPTARELRAAGRGRRPRPWEKETPVAGKSRGEQHIGLLNGFAAYGMWGLVPLFWPLLKPAGAIEILAHRMVWSLAVVAIGLLALRRWRWIGELVRQPRKLGLTAIAASVISVNWGLYIWSVN